MPSGEELRNPPPPLRAVYVDMRNINYSSPEANVYTAIAAGYNVGESLWLYERRLHNIIFYFTVVAAFYIANGPADYAAAWAAVSSSVKAATVAAAHKAGAVLLVAAGGATCVPYNQASVL
jgi:hypothetical protein